MINNNIIHLLILDLHEPALRFLVVDEHDVHGLDELLIDLGFEVSNM